MVTVAWDPVLVCIDLQKSCQILTERCLKLSSKWAAEQWMGLPPDVLANAVSNTKINDDDDDNNDNDNDNTVDTTKQPTITTIPIELEWNYYKYDKYNPGLQYARTLLELGEYLHAAAVLSESSSISMSSSTSTNSSNQSYMSKPLSNLSSIGIYIRAYSLYLAGEKQKEESKLIIEKHCYNTTSNNKSSSTNGGSTTTNTNTNAAGANGTSSDSTNISNTTPINSNIPNPYRQQLLQELFDVYEKDQLDAFGLHVYGMVLKEAMIGTNNNTTTATNTSSLTTTHDTPTAQYVLIQSILQFPYNWSAWLDLAEIVLYNDSNPTMNSSSSTTNGKRTNPSTTGGIDDTIINSNNNDFYDDNSNNRSKYQQQQQQQNQTIRQQVERDIEEYLQPELAGHFMYHFFCAHLQAERQAHSDAIIIYERWMDPLLFQGSPYLLSQYAVCSYHTRQFATAKSLLEDLHNHMPYRLDCMDVYSNILYVQEDSVALSQLAHTAVHVDKYRAETCCIVGNYYSLKQHRAKAIQYFQRAIKIDPYYTSAWTLMGHEYVEWKQTGNAMAAYRRAVQIAPADYRAWYGLGQTYELLNMNLYALYYYKQATQLRPYDSRMWCAIGMTYTNLSKYNDAIRAYERAVQEDDTEGIATQKLASLYKKQINQDEKAAACYWRHLEIRHLVTNNTNTAPSPRHGNTNDNNGIKMNNEGKESLEKMLHGIYIESTEAEAILFLAHYHQKHGQYEIAAVFCSRLLEYPGPEKEEAKAILRELRSRVSMMPILSSSLSSSTAQQGGNTSMTSALLRSNSALLRSTGTKSRVGGRGGGGGGGSSEREVPDVFEFSP